MVVLIRKINEISSELGMEINKDKSMILTFNADDDGEIEVILPADSPYLIFQRVESSTPIFEPKFLKYLEPSQFWFLFQDFKPK